MLRAVLAASLVVVWGGRGAGADEGLQAGTPTLEGPAAFASPVPDGARPRPYSVQLHVHGSFSEGVGSIDSHSWEARDVGADAIWWSDHDFRIESYRHASRFGFEAWAEPLAKDEPWAADREGSLVKGVAASPIVGGSTTGAAEITSDAADEGVSSLRVEDASPGELLASRLHEIYAHRDLFKRPLASDITLDISILPEELTEDSRVVVDIALSEHAPAGGEPLSAYSLRYRLSNAGDPARVVGTRYEVPVSFTPGVWNRLQLPLTRDVAAGFGEMAAEDNSAARIAVGVETRRGVRASALFDRLVIRQRIAGPSAFERQAEVIRDVSALYPGLRELQGVEISYLSPHLNEFSIATRLLDYDAIRASLRGGAGAMEAGARRPALRDLVALEAVDAAHARDGLISYNHMFGAAMEEAEGKRSREEVLAELLATRLYGADLLEVGYRDRGGAALSDHLWVWDRLAASDLYPVGVGVSDSHGGPQGRWRSARNNFLTWIYATGTGKAELIEGMRAGRAFFGDIVKFDGALDVTTDTGFRMGQIVATDRRRANVTFSASGAESGDVVRVVRSGEIVATRSVSQPTFEISMPIGLSAGEPTVVRFELYDAGGGIRVLSNPITFVRTASPHGIPPARAAIDVGGLRSRAITGFTLRKAKVARAADGSRFAVVRGRGESGSIDLDVAGAALPPGGALTVSFHGLTGRAAQRDGARLLLEDLRGAGRIEIRGLTR